MLAVCWAFMTALITVLVTSSIASFSCFLLPSRSPSNCWMVSSRLVIYKTQKGYTVLKRVHGYYYRGRVEFPGTATPLHPFFAGWMWWFTIIQQPAIPLKMPMIVYWRNRFGTLINYLRSPFSINQQKTNLSKNILTSSSALRWFSCAVRSSSSSFWIAFSRRDT